ncbi:DUF397 domain-containing protein [Streptomyces pactum]|uniref:DUF397 domain-containing protein n=1 Tax=Streptomyces pactum TaxID=68249 RepID=A0ABS0NPK9_9ACTN|nr:DUF397 domain-containing protein [Streptomyces pactum]MBH5337130.1 DUF397 domain-containing protein [Streptomyces pactum]
MPDSTWVKSSFSETGGNACVELATTEDNGIAIRESEIPGTVMATRPASLRAFLGAAKAGRFDGLGGATRRP